MIIATSTESQMLGITCYSHLIVIVEHFLSFKVKRIRYSENRNNNDPIYGVLFSKTILYLRNSQDLYQNLTLYFTGRACVTRVSDNEVHCPLVTRLCLQTMHPDPTIVETSAHLSSPVIATTIRTNRDGKKDCF